MTATLEGGEWSAACRGCTLPPGKTWYPLYRRLGGSQGRSGWLENLVPTGIRSQTIQPVVSHYTDCAARPTVILSGSCKYEYFTAKRRFSVTVYLPQFVAVSLQTFLKRERGWHYTGIWLYIYVETGKFSMLWIVFFSVTQNIFIYFLISEYWYLCFMYLL